MKSDIKSLCSYAIRQGRSATACFDCLEVHVHCDYGMRHISDFMIIKSHIMGLHPVVFGKKNLENVAYHKDHKADKSVVGVLGPYNKSRKRGIIL